MFINEIYHWGIDPHNRGWQENYLNRLGMNVIKKMDENIGMSASNSIGYPMNNRPSARPLAMDEPIQPLHKPEMTAQSLLSQPPTLAPAPVMAADPGMRGPSLDAGPAATGLQKQAEIQMLE